jgi:hypothetical protein
VIAGHSRSAYKCTEHEWRFTTVHIVIDRYGELGHHMLFDLSP